MEVLKWCKMFTLLSPLLFENGVYSGLKSNVCRRRNESSVNVYFKKRFYIIALNKELFKLTTPCVVRQLLKTLVESKNLELGTIVLGVENRPKYIF